MQVCEGEPLNSLFTFFSRFMCVCEKKKDKKKKKKKKKKKEEEEEEE